MFGTWLRTAGFSASLAVVFAAAGCIASTFVVTDGRAVGRPRTQPDMFIDRLPQYPYYSIGIIEVRAPAGTELGRVVEEALRKGGEVGCDLVIDRGIYRVTYGIPGARALVAQVTMVPAPYAPPPAASAGVVYTPPPDRREFICGVASVPRPAAPSPPSARVAPTTSPGHLAAGADVRTAPSSVAPVLMHVSAEAQITIGRLAGDGWRVVTLPDGREGYARESDLRVH